MSRYIDADRLYKDITRSIDYCEDILEIVERQPAAEVAEVKHGRWIVDREFGNDVMSDEQMVICSVCGKGIFWGKQNYCPNCGAKMEEDDDHHD